MSELFVAIVARFADPDDLGTVEILGETSGKRPITLGHLRAISLALPGYVDGRRDDLAGRAGRAEGEA